MISSIAPPANTSHEVVWDQAAADQLIERCLVSFIAGLRHADRLTLGHEAERLETMPASPAIVRLRSAVDAEQARRATEAAGR